MEEYSARDNCRIFIDLLQGMSLDGLIDKYTNGGKDFYALLQLRKYACALPREYRDRIDIEERKLLRFYFNYYVGLVGKKSKS